MNIKIICRFPQLLTVLLFLVAIGASPVVYGAQGLETNAGAPTGPVQNLAGNGKILVAQNAQAKDTDQPVYQITAFSTKVELDGSSIIIIEATGPIQYTAFKLMNPLRLVLDFPNMRPGDLKERVEINKGVVDSVRPLYFEDAAVVRLEIALKNAAEYDIQKPRNNKIIVHLKEAPVEVAAALPETEPETIPARQTGAKRVGSEEMLPLNQPQPTDPCFHLLSGKKEEISLDFQGANIRNLLRIISDISGFNLILSSTVSKSSEKIHMRLLEVPWNTAFEVILANSKLGRKCAGNNIIRIDTLQSFAEEEEMKVAALNRQREEEESLRLTQDLITEVVRIDYADVNELADNLNKLLQSQSQGSGSGGGGRSQRRGLITVDVRTNTLILNDIPENIHDMLELIKILDVRTPQVMIEARIVEMNKDFSEELGIQWGLTGGFGGQPDGVTVNGATSGSKFLVDLVPNAATALSTSGIGFVLGGLGRSAELNIQLNALETTSDTRILSSPKVTTLDNKEARIKQGFRIPFETTSADGTTTEFIDAELSLTVTPHITSDNYVLMEIDATNNTADTTFATASSPASISTKEAHTEVLVKSGDTTVLGGIYTSNISQKKEMVPLLSKIPILGYLFKNYEDVDKITELLIFVSPTIITQSN